MREERERVGVQVLYEGGEREGGSARRREAQSFMVLLLTNV